MSAPSLLNCVPLACVYTCPSTCPIDEPCRPPNHSLQHRVTPDSVQRSISVSINTVQQLTNWIYNETSCECTNSWILLMKSRLFATAKCIFIVQLNVISSQRSRHSSTSSRSMAQVLTSIVTVVNYMSDHPLQGSNPWQNQVPIQEYQWL